MTLKEKFEEVDRFTLMRESHNEKCVEIVDEFAIGFGEWLSKQEYNLDFWVQHNQTTLLLEIYKREKGL